MSAMSERIRDSEIAECISRLRNYKSPVQIILEGMSDAEREVFYQEMREAEEPCVRCHRCILAGCRDPLCGQPN